MRNRINSIFTGTVRQNGTQALRDKKGWLTEWFNTFKRFQVLLYEFKRFKSLEFEFQNSSIIKDFKGLCEHAFSWLHF